MNRTAVLLTAALLGAASARAEISGRYVEARTASVFAGACHYNGELVTRGRDAVLAFRVDAGEASGQALSGLAALAVLSAPENLAEPSTARRSFLVIDEAATDAQAAALADVLRSRYAAVLGDVVAVKRAPVRFTENGGRIEVSAGPYAALSVTPMPDRACCKMPHLVWYEPLVPLAERRVGYTTRAESSGGDRFSPWSDAGENTAFVGSF
jgi:hypothetical protein